MAWPIHADLAIESWKRAKQQVIEAAAAAFSCMSVSFGRNPYLEKGSSENQVYSSIFVSQKRHCLGFNRYYQILPPDIHVYTIYMILLPVITKNHTAMFPKYLWFF